MLPTVSAEQGHAFHDHPPYDTMHAMRTGLLCLLVCLTVVLPAHCSRSHIGKGPNLPYIVLCMPSAEHQGPLLLHYAEISRPQSRQDAAAERAVVPDVLRHIYVCITFHWDVLQLIYLRQVWYATLNKQIRQDRSCMPAMKPGVL